MCLRGEEVCIQAQTEPAGSVLCGRSERASGEGGGRLIRGGYSRNGPGLCTHLCIRKGEEACVHQAQTEPAGLVLCGRSERASGEGGGRLTREGTVKTSRVCARVRAFTRGRRYVCTRHKPSRRS